VTDAGTEAGPSDAVLSGTMAPSAGAGADRVTLPLAGEPAVIGDGDTTSDEITGPPAGSTTTSVLAPLPFNETVTDVTVGADTTEMGTDSVPPVAPQPVWKVTGVCNGDPAGAVATTVTPAGGAAPSRSNCTGSVVPPTTLAGRARVWVTRVGSFCTLNLRVSETAALDAVRVTGCDGTDGGVNVIVNVATS